MIIRRDVNNVDGTSNAVRLELNVCVILFAVGVDGLLVAIPSNVEPGGVRRLPCGAPDPNELLGACARRLATEALCITPDYMEQLYTFGQTSATTRFIVAYFGLLSTATRVAAARWDCVAFEHVDRLAGFADTDQRILEYAKIRLRAKLGYSNIAFAFLPPEFTLSDLQDVYESVIGERLDKRNFRRRVLAAGIVEPVGAKRPTNHRPASLYRFVGGDPATGALTPGDIDWST